MLFLPSYGIPLATTQSLSVGATATGLTVPVGATAAIVSVETEAVRYRDDGTAPTATVGVYLPVTATIGSLYSFIGRAILANIQFIATTGTATVTVAYYKV